MIHPLATTTPCKFAVVSLAAKEKINKYMERNLLWICKHWFAQSSGFLFNCSAYTSTRTHTKWGCEFMVRKQGGTYRPSVYCCLVFTFRDVLPVYLPVFSYLFISFMSCLSFHIFSFHPSLLWVPYILGVILVLAFLFESYCLYQEFPSPLPGRNDPLQTSIWWQGCGKEKESPWQPANGLTVSLGNTSSLCVFWSLSPASIVPEEAQLGERLTSFLARAACPWGLPSPSLSK